MQKELLKHKEGKEYYCHSLGKEDRSGNESWFVRGHPGFIQAVPAKLLVSSVLDNTFSGLYVISLRIY